ncbi:hypothetical protein B0H14DRAFT_3154956 [Mycena olivaceomarginata]|nr:hypothetical protein B0H14DRAFT_3154956 [Mycena olivaceomarginata]
MDIGIESRVRPTHRLRPRQRKEKINGRREGSERTDVPWCVRYFSQARRYTAAAEALFILALKSAEDRGGRRGEERRGTNEVGVIHVIFPDLQNRETTKISSGAPALNPAGATNGAGWGEGVGWRVWSMSPAPLVGTASAAGRDGRRGKGGRRKTDVAVSWLDSMLLIADFADGLIRAKATVEHPIEKRRRSGWSKDER